MRNAIPMLLMCIFSTISYSQEDILSDSLSIDGKIIHNLKRDSKAGFSITRKDGLKTYQGYRLCDHQYVDVQNLNKTLTDKDVEILLNCENGTLKAVGFIIFSIRSENKNLVLNRLNQILDEEFVLMTNNCSDAISTSSLGRFGYNILTKPNFFYNPNFKLSKYEIRYLESKIISYEKIN